MNLFELMFKIGVDDQASSKVGQIAEKVGNGLKTAAKIGAAALGAAAAGVTALTKSSLSQYAEYEQLVGGVETLFEDAADTVAKNAESAFTRSGLSINAYMDTVTSFSASLIQSVSRTSDINLDLVKQNLEEELAATKKAAEQEYNDRKTALDLQLAIYKASSQEEIALMDKNNKAGTESAKKERSIRIAEMKAANEKELADLKAANEQKLESLKAYNEQAYAEAEAEANMAVVTAESRQKAAEIADMAIVDMSDNANKMGTAIESIQNAYNGFAKANFTMLDNLKLGYGGTKTEMERLLKAAEDISGIEYDVNSYADIVEAIHVIQTEMGITGTTAKEASTTISGSFATLQSAWANLVTGLGNGEADLGKLVDDVVTSAETVVANVLPAGERILDGITELIGRVSPLVSEYLPGVVTEILPEIIEAGFKLITALGKGIIDSAPEVLEAIIQAFRELLQEIGILEEFDFAIEKAKEFFAWFDSGAASAEALRTVLVSLTAAFGTYKLITEAVTLGMKAQELATKAVAAGQKLLNAVMNANKIGLIVSAVAALVAALIYLWNTNEDFRNFWIEAWEGIKSAFISVWDSLSVFFTEKIPETFNSVVDFLKELPKKALSWGADLVNNFIDGLKAKWESLKTTVSNIAGSVKDFLGFSEPEKGPLSNFHTYAPDMMKLFAEGIRDNEHLVTDQLEKSFDFSPTIAESSGVQSIGSADSGILRQMLGKMDGMLGMTVTLDSGELVGALTPKLNTSLGNRLVADRRGVIA